jgi:uncharacterized protein with HEPN domain
MSKRSDLVYVGTLLDAARRAAAKAEGVSRAQYEADENLRLALTWLVQNVGEAASKVPPAVRETHPEIDWQGIAAMRHRIVHDYVHVDFQKVWEAATTDIPALIRDLLTFMPPDPQL